MKTKLKQRVFYDQMGYKVIITGAPQRIVSLVPSQTELLWYLGLDKEVIGITKFCVHPDEWFRTKKRIGGTKNLNLVYIAELKPDLIIGNKEENKEEQVKQLMQHYPVWMSDIHNLNDALEMIKGVGTIVGKEEKANELVANIQEKFKTLISLNPLKGGRGAVAYFIWKKPYMTIGKHAFINSMLEVCNFKNVFSELPSDYPEVTPEQIRSANPELILLSSEPFPFSEKHIAEFRQIAPDAKIMLVDGEYFSWYGSRLLEAPGYFRKVVGKAMDN